jgi:predicted permease
MRWLLRLLGNDADRRAIESDLAELYELRRRELGTRAANRWLRRQYLSYPWHLFLDRCRRPIPRATTMPYLWRDIRYSLRSLAHVPALSATIVLTVGIGLGATSAMIGLVRAVLVDPLPYAHSEELFWIYTDTPPYWFRLSVVDYRALEADHPTFSGVAAYQTNFVTVSGRGSTERVARKEVTGSYFPLLGQRAQIGRVFDPSDDKAGERTVVLTDAFWTRRFARNRGVLGQPVSIDGAPHTIVGVLERTAGPLEHDIGLFTPAHWPEPTRKGPFFTTVLARMGPRGSRAAALSALKATNRRLFPIWRSSYQDEKATWGLQDLKARVVGEIGSTLNVVLAAVACVLLIACANAVNLLIARGLHRSREMTIRGALGASRGRLVQHLLVEAAALTVAAALVALGVAAASLQLVAIYGADYVPRIDEVRMSGAVIGWLAGLSLASGLIIGLIPALHGSRQPLDHALRTGGRSATDGPGARRVRRALVATEFALATPLLVAATLVAASLDRLTRVPVGIDMPRFLTAEVSLPAASYGRDAERDAFWKRAALRLAALPGVEAAAAADSRPPSESGNQNNFDLEDRPTPNGQNQPICTWVGVSTGFFATVGLRLEQGRLLDDHSPQENAVVVDRAWVNRFFPGQEAVGRRFHEGGCTTCAWTTVIGVVSNMRWIGLDAPAEDGTVYFPLGASQSGFFVLRAKGVPVTLVPSLRQAAKELDPGLALSNVATGDELMSDALATPRYLTVLIGVFACAALVLSIVGIYGVMAYFVQQHSREIGIRLALGGEPARVRRMVVFQGLRLTLAGVTVGIAASFVASRVVETLLYGVDSTDPRMIVGIPVALMAVALIACLVPAQRAARLDPAAILRDDA